MRLKLICNFGAILFLFVCMCSCVVNPDSEQVKSLNEYLRADLEKDHRRVFEALASRAKAEYNDNQLSGLGFSSTQRNELVVKIDNKSFKIKF